MPVSKRDDILDEVRFCWINSSVLLKSEFSVFLSSSSITDNFLFIDGFILLGAISLLLFGEYSGSISFSISDSSSFLKEDLEDVYLFSVKSDDIKKVLIIPDLW